MGYSGLQDMVTLGDFLKATPPVAVVFPPVDWRSWAGTRVLLGAAKNSTQNPLKGPPLLAGRAVAQFFGAKRVSRSL